MTNQLYIKILMIWCCAMPTLYGQADYCTDTLYFCNYSTTILEGNGELVGPFQMSTLYYPYIDFDFDGENIHIHINNYFYGYDNDFLILEDQGTGLICQIPFVYDSFYRQFFETPDIECLEHNYYDPALNYSLVYNHGKKFNYCLGDKVTYTIDPDSYNPYYPAPPYDFLTPERITQTLGDIEKLDSFSLDIAYNKAGYELLELTTFNEIGCIYTEYYPVEVFDTLPPKIVHDGGADLPSTFCQGEQLKLSSPDGKELTIEVSNGYKSSASQFVFSLDVPGTYQIKVTEESQCGCNTPAYYTIEVVEAIAPAIVCTGTLCDGGEVTYYSQQKCDSYLWSVENGSIVGGGGEDQDYVTIFWSDASSGSITLSTPDCASSQCSEVTVKDIPIIDASAPILGMDSICTGDISTYSVPDYNGTTFNWEVSEGGYILSGKNENTVEVKWNAGVTRETAIVSVQYENCDINCQGYSEKEITILPVFALTLDQTEYCINSEMVLTNNLGDIVNYSIFTPLGDTIVFENVDSVIYTLDTTGFYGFAAFDYNDGVCNTEDQTMTGVSFYPEPISELNGPQAICKTQNVSYSAVLNHSDETIIWEVFDGDLSVPLYTTTSRQLDYQWISDGPYQITAVVHNIYTKCSSDPSIFVFHSDLEITGVDSVCLQTPYWYTFNGNPVASNKWIIEPDLAGIILSIEDNKVSIVWQLEGNHKISIDQCDKTTEFEVYVEPENILSHDSPEHLCKNDSVLVSFSSTIPAEFDVIRKWTNDTVATADSPSGYLIYGEHNMYATTEIGCTEDKYLYIQNVNPPTAKIRVNGSTKWCGSGSTTLEARFYNTSRKYQWFRNGVLLPGKTGRYLTTNQFGSYTLRVINQYGCESMSSAVILEECCDNESAPINDYSIDIEETIVRCDVRTFEVLPTFFSSTFRWTARRFGSTYYMGTGTEVTYTFPSAGTYTVFASGDALCQNVDVKVCGIPMPVEICEGGRKTVTIPVVANFSTDQNCNAKTVKFNETSSKISSFGLKYEWDFGDPGSGNNNTSTFRHPTHTYDSIGTYTVNLTITHPSGCITKKSKYVTVRDRPEVIITTNQSFCLDSYVRFYGNVESGSGLIYSWDFDDPSSGNSNTTSQKNPYHKFSKAGTYSVRLKVKDPNDCVDYAYKTVTIVENDLSGQIESDKIYPKCPGEDVTLTAPSGPMYKWSNGDSVQQINVVDEGNYRVTISNEYGCTHVTDYHYVDDYVFQDVQLFARVYNENGANSIRHDSIELCVGDEFDLEASYIPQSKYVWSNSSTEDHILTYDDDFSSLPPGRYEYVTNVLEIPSAYKVQIALLNAGYDLGPNGADGTLNVDTKQALLDFQSNNGLSTGALDGATLTALEIYPCEVQAGPFVIIIRDLPGVPVVDSDLETNCEGELSTMFVSNSSEHQSYLWTTGVEGIEITAYAAGEYQVTTTDSLGCKSASDAIEIYENPEVSAWMTGCREVCFPEEICIDLRPEFTYSLIKDGVEGSSLNVLSGDLEIDSVGEYQLMATNSDGCSVVSDLLVLTKTPDDHDLSGIVYYDENENNMYDQDDVLLEGVPVYLINPDSIIAETITDIDGYYEFVGFEDYDLQTLIDPSDVDYIIQGPVDSLVTYETCVEERLIDFPLINNCQQIPMNVEKVICTGTTIVIDGIEYGEFDTDTLVYRLAANCDSIVYLKVNPFPIPEIDLSTVASCDGENVGVLEINQSTGDTLLFSVDGLQNLYSETTIEGLDKGMHTLYVHTDEGCVHPHEFEIVEMPVPIMEFETVSTCVGLSEGKATLTVSVTEDLEYSLDQGNSYTDLLVHDSLPAGTYELWAIDSIGCIYEAQFEVLNYEEPLFELSNLNSCIDENNGSISIDMLNDVGTEFRLLISDSWVQDSSFINLEPGQYTLHSKSEFGCLDSTTFEITTIPEPVVGFTITEECSSHSLGLIEIVSDSTLTFSLDGVNFVQEAIFDSLDAGMYTIYVQDEHLCIYEFVEEIPLLPIPVITLNPSTTCLDESMGVVEIEDLSSIDFSYSIDDSLYTTDLLFDALSAGTYNLFVQNGIGCIYNYEFEIEETLPPTVSLEHDDSCPNDDTGILIVSTSGDKDLVYVNNGDGSTDRIFEELQPGIYEVLVEDTLGCTSLADIEILEVPPLIVEQPELDADCYKDKVVIEPKIESHYGPVIYLWEDGSTSESFVATKPGQYAVTISDDCDITSHTWDLTVRHTANDDHLYSSNIFSPNNDGVNDCFNVLVDSDLVLIEFHYIIFDRWGNKMFETTNTEDCWDGNYNGAPVVPGVYVVMSRATVLECDGMKKIRKVSDVTVFR